MHVRTTIAVSVTVKIDIEGDFKTPEDLIREATFNALTRIDHALDYANQTTLTTEGATALVNREALAEMFYPSKLVRRDGMLMTETKARQDDPIKAAEQRLRRY